MNTMTVIVVVVVFLIVLCHEIYPGLCQGEQLQIGVNFTCDDTGTLYADDKQIASTTSHHDVFIGKMPSNSSWVAVKCFNKRGPGGLMVSLGNGLVTNEEDWLCSSTEQSDSSNWVTAHGDNGTIWDRPGIMANNTRGGPWGYRSSFPEDAKVIWYWDSYEGTFYCKAEINSSPTTVTVVSTTQPECPVCLPCDDVTVAPVTMTTEQSPPEVVTEITIEEVTISKEDMEELAEPTEAHGARGFGVVFLFLVIGEICLIVIVDLTSLGRSVRYCSRSISQSRKRIKKKSDTSSETTGSSSNSTMVV